MNPKLTEILVCPLCKGHLSFAQTSNELVCRFDKLAYPICDDIPVMLTNEARELSSEEMDALK